MFCRLPQPQDGDPDKAQVSVNAERAQAAVNDPGSRLNTALMAKIQAESLVAVVGYCRENASRRRH